MRRLKSLALLILVAGTVLAQQPPHLDESLPGEVFLTPTVDLELQPVPLRVPDKFKGKVPEGQVLNLPVGFSATVFAVTGLVGPRFMDWSPDGVLHVANMKVEGGQWSPKHDTSEPPAEEEMFAQIVALPDRDRDGVADTAIVVADRLWFPHSLQFYQGDLYVGDMHQVVRLSDLDDDGFYEERTVVIGDLPAGHHRTRTILFDHPADKLYLSIGSSCDLCRETNERRATIMQSDPDGSNLRVYARGLRNAIGMAFHPLTRSLWITGNGHDQEGNHLPPEAVTVVEEGGFYGWPVAYGHQVSVDFGIGQYSDAILPLTRQDTLDIESMARPTVQLPAHLAPMAIYFYARDIVADYKGAALVALRGSGRDEEGHKVVSIFSEPDGSQARVGDFITGFEANARGDSWGKPVGLTGDAEGNLYLSSDWINHIIVRIEPSPRSTWIEEEYTDAPPLEFSLGQNQSNPFNSSTTIRFDLPLTGFVRLAIYNLAGQEVSELIRGSRRSGSYALTWDGSDREGRPLASGVYLYRLESGDRVEVRKLLLVQ